MGLVAVPLSLAEANEVVECLHRHHKPVVGYKFAIGCELDGVLVGAVIVSRPVARGVDYRTTAEATRLATNGDKNACSSLYSRAARAAAAMGYRKIQTYLLEGESGTSLRAAGWHFEALTAGGDWNHSKRNKGTRRTDQPMGRKQRWSKDLSRS